MLIQRSKYIIVYSCSNLVITILKHLIIDTVLQQCPKSNIAERLESSEPNDKLYDVLENSNMEYHQLASPLF